MIVMGLDPSTKTGYYIFKFFGGDKCEILAKGVITRKPMADRFQRYNDMAVELQALLHTYQPDLVIIEGYGYANAHTLATLVEVGTVLRYFIWQEGIEMREVAPNALKKFITGNGNAKKDQIMLAVFKRWGVECKTNDEADAFGLAMFGAALNHLIEVPATNMKPVCAHCGKNCT